MKKNKQSLALQAKKGFTIVELLIGIIIFGSIFTLATSIIVNLLVSNTKSKFREVLEQTKNDLQAELGNGAKWASSISFVNGDFEVDKTVYKLDYNSGRIYKDATPVTSDEVFITKFEVLKYSSPSIADEPDSGIGLRAEYFDAMNFTESKISQIDLNVDYDWGNESPSSLIDENTFSVRWTGQVEAPVTGRYSFYTVSDDGVRLWVNNELVINNWTVHGPTLDRGVINLDAEKRYDIRLDFFENGGGAVIKLGWSYPGVTDQIIPPTRLYPTLSPSSLQITVEMHHKNNTALKESLSLVLSPRGGIIGAIEEAPVDACPNLDLFQPTVPAGYRKVGGNCEKIPDACPNIPGDQEVVPPGKIIVGGLCVDAPPEDLCKNEDLFPGIQTRVPDGYIKVGPNCILPPPPPPPQPPPPVVPPPNPLR